jgi:hypothetical protein
MKMIKTMPKPCNPGESSNSPNTMAKAPERIPMAAKMILIKMKVPPSECSPEKSEAVCSLDVQSSILEDSALVHLSVGIVRDPLPNLDSIHELTATHDHTVLSIPTPSSMQMLSFVTTHSL